MFKEELLTIYTPGLFGVSNDLDLAIEKDMVKWLSPYYFMIGHLVILWLRNTTRGYHGTVNIHVLSSDGHLRLIFVIDDYHANARDIIV